MVCPNCKHVYPISNGIPNMVRIHLSLLSPLLSSLLLSFLPSSFSPASLPISAPESTAISIAIRLLTFVCPHVNQLLAEHEIG